MKQKNLVIRKATKEDINLLYELINGLAIYEKRPNDMTGSIEMLNYWLFEKSVATAFIAENDKGNDVGYAIYYPIFSSFSAMVKIHLEDLFIKPDYRHQGYGKEFFFKLAKIIKEEGYIELEWNCLDWNVPSIEFYRKIGALQEKGRVYFGYKLTK